MANKEEPQTPLDFLRDRKSLMRGNAIRTPQPEVRARLIEIPDDGSVLVLTLDRQSFRKLSREAKEHGRSLEGHIQDILEEATRRTTPEGGA